MNKEQFKQAIETVKKSSPKRKFTQSFDLIINLKDINLKDPSQQLDLFVPLHFSKGKKTKVCALVGIELAKQAKEVCDFAVESTQFEKYAKDKKLIKKLANDYDFFIAQANLMADVAKTFGRVFGPKGKMPNPKAGCVVPPTANLKQVYDKLQNMVRIVAKTAPSVQVIVGNEDMKEEEVLDNIITVFNQVIHHLPGEKNNIKNVYLKVTMGQSLKVGAKEEEAKPEEKKEEAAEEPKKEAPKEEKPAEKPKAEKKKAAPKKKTAKKAEE